jgi:hypothetical protein
MAGWVTVFKAIPWAGLLAAAPSMVKSARELWTAVRHRDAPGADGQGPEAAQRAIEAQVEELRQELTAASEVITKLAEHNSRLVEAIEVLRMRTRALFVLVTILIVAWGALAILFVAR